MQLIILLNNLLIHLLSLLSNILNREVENSEEKKRFFCKRCIKTSD